MARCANCGTEISGGDKTRLCDNCKRIIFPFIKLTDVSTSSAVRRLTANERNLRSAGVTDTGMEYLYRICEINDRRRQAEKEARERARAAQEQPMPPVYEDEPPRGEETVPPAAESLELHREPYGTFLTAAEVILIAAGAAGAVWFIVQIVMKQGPDAAPVITAVASFAAAYVAHVLKKTREDLAEIKKRFR